MRAPLLFKDAKSIDFATAFRIFFKITGFRTPLGRGQRGSPGPWGPMAGCIHRSGLPLAVVVQHTYNGSDSSVPPLHFPGAHKMVTAVRHSAMSGEDATDECGSLAELIEQVRAGSQ